MTPTEAHALISNICRQALAAGAFQSFDAVQKVTQALYLLEHAARAFEDVVNPAPDADNKNSNGQPKQPSAAARNQK